MSLGLLFDHPLNFSIFLCPDLGEELNCLAWDGRTIYLGGGTGNISIWDLNKGQNLLKIPAHKGPVKAICVSKEGDFIATGGEDRRVIVWTTRSIEPTYD